jgi:uncharacterized LabA/DUF88 family protein
MTSDEERIALFIDGPNLYATAKTLGFDIDFRRLLEEFQSRGILVHAFYYTTIFEDQDFAPIRPLTDWLAYNGLPCFLVAARASGCSASCKARP